MLLLVGKPPEDSALLLDVKLKPGAKIMMMGTREEALVGYKSPIDSLFIYFSIDD
jgi:ubiquitin-like domain-containing CTD phosphatase 1